MPFSCVTDFQAYQGDGFDTTKVVVVSCCRMSNV